MKAISNRQHEVLLAAFRQLPDFPEGQSQRYLAVQQLCIAMSEVPRRAEQLRGQW